MRPIIHVALDIGAVNVRAVAFDRHLNVLLRRCVGVQGSTADSIEQVLKEVRNAHEHGDCRITALTGSTDQAWVDRLGLKSVSAVTAALRGAVHLVKLPGAVLSIGGEKSYFIRHTTDPHAGKTMVREYRGNSLCSSGTGMFIEQEAHRFNLTLDEFVDLALTSEKTLHLAGRCAVFAKSDAVHYHQTGAHLEDIAYAICRSVAQTVADDLMARRQRELPLVLVGGVAANAAVRQALADILGVDPAAIIVPEDHAYAQAIGAQLHVTDTGAIAFRPISEALESLASPLRGRSIRIRARDPLKPQAHLRTRRHNSQAVHTRNSKYFLGIDIGSTTTNVACVARGGELLDAVTIPTRGQSMAAVKAALSEVSSRMSSRKPLAVGITGSGRRYVGAMIGADTIIDEITAHAEAGLHLYPDVDTIFDIGGQDSKFIRIESGHLADFEMNKVCSAGTGSFLEEAAVCLGLDVRNGFAEVALSAMRPIDLGERCAVFILRELKEQLEQGVPIDDLAAGLCYSIVENFLARVARSHDIGDVISFQGGVAGNVAVVAAFEQLLGRPVHVHRDHHVAGAVGAALLAESHANGSSQFRGFDAMPAVAARPKAFKCARCSNSCTVRYVDSPEGGSRFFFGSTCGRWDLPAAKRDVPDEHDPLVFRNRLLTKHVADLSDEPRSGDIGIPQALHFAELMPFWITFFNELGVRYRLSGPSERKMILKGSEVAPSSTCLPLKSAYGHCHELVRSGLKRLFVPSVSGLSHHCQPCRLNHLCPGAQAWPYTVAAGMDPAVQILTPTVRFAIPKLGRRDVVSLGRALGFSTREAVSAYDVADSAQHEFHETLRDFGDTLLSTPDPNQIHAVLLSRPYMLADPMIANKLRPILKALDIQAIPFDMVRDRPLDMASLSGMYWYYGKRFLQTIRSLQSNPSAVFISLSTYGCGADSFIVHFLRDALAGLPFLELEIDQHGEFTGVHTRLEAFANSLKKRRRLARPTRSTISEGAARLRDRNVLIPQMSDHAYACASALKCVGQPCEVLPLPNDESLRLGTRYVTGGECAPCTALAGDMLNALRSGEQPPNRAAFLMISGDGPCRLGQYPYLHRKILDKQGYGEVPIVDMSQDTSFYDRCDVFSTRFKKAFWRGSVAIDLLFAKYRELRPRADKRSLLDRAYQEELANICDAQRDSRALGRQLRRSLERLSEFKAGPQTPEVRIGIVGENYIRCNSALNRNIAEKLEDLGAEVHLPFLTEWIHYTNWTARLHCRYENLYALHLKFFLVELHQNLSSRRLRRAARRHLSSLDEPSVHELFRMAAPYVPRSLEGETVVSVGRTVDYHAKGVDGVIQVVPFGCMVGTIYETLSSRLSDDLDGMPITTMYFDGRCSELSGDALESFILRAKSWKQLRQRPS